MDKYIEYVTNLNAREEVVKWTSTVLKNYLKQNQENQSEIEHIIDYLISDQAPQRLLKMSYQEALSNTEKWVKALNKKGANLVDSQDDIETIKQLDNDYSIVLLKTNNAYLREGTLMHHCLGGYELKDNVKIYSLRDKDNNPHATFEVYQDNEEISQIKGKGNGPIHPRYIDYVLEFLDSVGQKIRPSDMNNLGYYHVPKDYLDMIKLVDGGLEQLVEVKNELYAVER